MSLASVKSPFVVFLKTLGYLFLFILFGLFLDSFYLEEVNQNSQLLANISMLIGFSIVFWKATSRIRKQIIYAVILGVIGEYLFSILLGMYTYRLNSVPYYVPPGHAVVYISVLYFSLASAVKKQRKNIEKIFTIFVVVYATAFLVFANDIFGFVMSMAVLIILRNKPRERLFYLTMYLAVAFLEIVGTHYQCWKWPETAWGVIPFLKSSNPPSGISLFYFLLDLGCLWIYKKRHKIAWKRMKNIRSIKS